MARPQKSLALFPGEPLAAPSPPSPPRIATSARHELWLAVHLPRLPLDALVHDATAAAAVVEPQRGHIRVVAPSRAAAAYGIRRGLKLPAALALCGTLVVLERSPAAERAALESLAVFAHGLSPTVSILPPAAVLLEIGGSLKLFGSIAAVKERMAAELGRRGFTHRSCAAPTALAAAWLARAGCADVLAPEHLASCLSSLPLRVTGWPEPVLELLSEMGVRTVGECLRLPRGGLARRAGKACLDDLDKARGLQLDLRPAHAPPVHMRLRVELLQECADHGVLTEVAAELLAKLAADLERKQCQVQSFTLVIEHRRAPETVEHFELVAADHRRERFTALVAARLERVALCAPAVAVRIESGVYRPLTLEAADLFAGGRRRGTQGELLERLRERLGCEAVFGVTAVADHRPELAWAERAEVAARSASPLPAAAGWVQRRPLWMLPEPLPLESPAARAYCGGAVHLRSGPERIESGWWDGRDVRRDYYTAIGESGRELWVYRDRVSRKWLLHGLFG